MCENNAHENISTTLDRIVWLAKKLKFKKGNARDMELLHGLTVSLYNNISTIGLEPRLADEFLIALRRRDYDGIIEYAKTIRETCL